MSIVRWRGVLGWTDERQRVLIGGLSFVLSVAITLMQLGFVGAVLPTGHVAYAVLQLLPLVYGSICLGPITGAILGMLAGAVMWGHSLILPLDYHELALITPMSSIGLLGAFGFLSGILFAISSQKGHTRMQRALCYCISCVLVSWFYSIGFSLNALILLSRGEVAGLTAAEYAAVFAADASSLGDRLLESVLQASIDAALTSICAVGVAALANRMRHLRDDIGIREAFNITIFTVVLLAYLVTATVSFCLATVSEWNRAEASVRSEVNYLCLQLEAQGSRAGAFSNLANDAGVEPAWLSDENRKAYEMLADPVGDLIEGYTMQETGTVAIISNGSILATDDKRLTVGAGVSEVLGMDTSEAIAASLKTGELQRIPYDGVLARNNDSSTHAGGTQIGFLLAGQYGKYTVMIIEPSSMFFKNRPTLMAREITIAIVLLTVVFIAVSLLLSNMVASRIDETNETLERITGGDLDARIKVGGAREFKALSSGINQTVDALNNWIAEAEERMNSELEAARTIQESALPRMFPPFPNIDAFDIYASMDAARVVGGDFYDFFIVGEHTLGFLIADVSGKGVPASLFMMEAKSELASHMKSGMDLDEAIRGANLNLCEGNESLTFVTVWAGLLNYETGELTYVNAGHNFPLLRHNGTWSWIDVKCGPIVGVAERARYRKQTIMLEPGDELMLYTDGVNEAFNVAEEAYGDDRLEAFLAAHTNLEPQTLVNELRADVSAWAQGAEQSDDITMLCLEYHPS